MRRVLTRSDNDDDNSSNPGTIMRCMLVCGVYICMFFMHVSASVKHGGPTYSSGPPGEHMNPMDKTRLVAWIGLAGLDT
eukprot:scaffold108722_cov49-Prasinocladus_malaysianus.AAC.1